MASRRARSSCGARALIAARFVPRHSRHTQLSKSMRNVRRSTALAVKLGGCLSGELVQVGQTTWAMHKTVFHRQFSATVRQAADATCGNRNGGRNGGENAACRAFTPFCNPGRPTTRPVCSVQNSSGTASSSFCCSVAACSMHID
jgi:hypothetical protein